MSYYTKDNEGNDIAVQERREGLFIFKNGGVDYQIPWAELYKLLPKYSMRDVLDTLPELSMIVDNTGVYFEFIGDGNYRVPGVPSPWTEENMAFPIRVVYVPESR